MSQLKPFYLSSLIICLALLLLSACGPSESARAEANAASTSAETSSETATTSTEAAGATDSHSAPEASGDTAEHSAADATHSEDTEQSEEATGYVVPPARPLPAGSISSYATGDSSSGRSVAPGYYQTVEETTASLPEPAHSAAHGAEAVHGEDTMASEATPHTDTAEQSADGEHADESNVSADAEHGAGETETMNATEGEATHADGEVGASAETSDHNDAAANSEATSPEAASTDKGTEAASSESTASNNEETDAASNAEDTATDTAVEADSNVVETAQDAANNAVEAVQETAGNAAEAVQTGAANAVEAVQDAAANAADAVQDTAEDVASAVASGVEAAGDAVDNASEAIAEAISPEAAPETSDAETAVTAEEGAPETSSAAGAEAPLLAQAVSYDEELGSTIYNGNCVACHQANGQGIPAAFPPLAGHIPNLYNAEGGREYIIQVVLYGLQGEIAVNDATYNGIMTPWAQLSDEEIAATLNHELNSWGNDALLEAFDPIRAEEVAALRGAGYAPNEILELRPAITD